MAEKTDRGGVDRSPEEATIVTILTQGERYRLERLRRHLNQHEMAAQLGTSRNPYQRWERSTGDKRKERIPLNEWCRVMRWRARKTQRNVADEMGLTRGWVNAMEVGNTNCGQLVDYWRNQKRLSPRNAGLDPKVVG